MEKINNIFGRDHRSLSRNRFETRCDAMFNSVQSKLLDIRAMTAAVFSRRAVGKLNCASCIYNETRETFVGA
jgi:hypothetical protein